MQVTIQIPDDLAERLGPDAANLSRRALEALAADEYRSGHLTKPDLRRLLGLETSYEIDRFLKSRSIFDNYTMRNFAEARKALKSSEF